MSHGPPEDSYLDGKQNAVSELRLTDEIPGFAADEMVACEDCSRYNPPTRTVCIYCGAGLRNSPNDKEKINYSQPEFWEEGFSLVYSGPSEPDRQAVVTAAEFLQLDVKTLEEMLAVRTPLPLVYLRSLTDAGPLASRLSESGFDCAIVGDDLLTPKITPTRVRSLRFDDGFVSLEEFNVSTRTALDPDQRILVVTGSLLKTQSERSGKISRRTLKTINESFTVTDEAVIDIYPESDVYGYRIRASGFDFSGLGERMTSIATENMTALSDELRSRFRAVKFVDSYRSAIQFLNAVWPTEQQNRSSGVSRGPFGGVRTSSLLVFDNTTQFTKFSRLQRHFG